jgi:hypothetical protein
MEFDSKSSLKRHLKENGLIEAGDRVGGARTFREAEKPGLAHLARAIPESEVEERRKPR